MNTTSPATNAPVFVTSAVPSPGGSGSGTDGKQMLPKNGLPDSHPAKALPPPRRVRARPGDEYFTCTCAQNAPSGSSNGSAPSGNESGGSAMSYESAAPPVRLELALAGRDAPREWLAAQADVGLDERVRCIEEHPDAEDRALAQEERITDVLPS